MAYSLEYAPYTLSAKRQLNRFGNSKVDGVLLKFTFADGKVGYSSLQTWPELGDRTMREEMEALHKKKPFSLGERSLDFAKKDSEARVNQIKLYSNLKVTNHYTLGVPSQCEIPESFTYVKIKLSANDLTSFHKHEWLKPYKLRIDFNLSLSLFDKDVLIHSLKGFDIDFLEDLGFSDEGFSLFYDEKKPEHKNWIIKPAKEILTETDERVLFTSYMDHPVNQLHAAIIANDFYLKNPNKKEICGLRTDLLFTDNSYLEYFSTGTTNLVLQEDGYGIGFTSLLENEKWQTYRG